MERLRNFERFLTRENAAAIISLIGISVVSFLSYSERQKSWIRRRDHNRCQFPDAHDCNGEEKTLNIHHILPQRYLTLLGVDPDYPENGISICENAHLGNGTTTPDKVIHPDMREALHRYREGDKEAYDQAFEQRRLKLENREVYWETRWDRQLTVIATRNTQNCTEPWPVNNHKDKHGKT